MLDAEIARDGPVSSFMIRSGLLRDLLDELARHRLASTEGREGMDQVETVAFAIAQAIAYRHGPSHKPDDWLNDARREEAKSVLSALRASDGAGDPAHRLAKAATDLVAATDSMEALRPQRQAVVEAMEAMLATPPAAQSAQTGAGPEL